MAVHGGVHTGGITRLTDVPRRRATAALFGCASMDSTITVVEVPLVAQAGAEAVRCRVARRLRGHRAAVTELLSVADSGLLFSGSADSDCRLWDVQRSASVGTRRGHRKEVSCLFVSRGGGGGEAAGLWSGSQGVVKRWDTRSEAAVSSSPLLAPSSRLGQATAPESGWVSHMGERGAHELVVASSSGCNDGKVRLFDTRRMGQPLCAVRAHNGPVTALHVGPQRIISAGLDASIKAWEFDDVLGMTGALRDSVSLAYSGFECVTSLAAAADHSSVVAAGVLPSGDWRVHRWDFTASK